METSLAMQRYAAEIYRLQEDHPYATLSGVAEGVKASLQAVSRMVKRMDRAGLLEHFPYKGMRLTAAGTRAALPAIRRHRLSEVFLVKVMGFGWDIAHDLTDTFEQGVDKQIEERMDALADHPRYCPHGNPIPTKDGQIEILDDRSITTLPEKMMGHITRIRTADGEILRYLAGSGLTPGVGFRVLSKAPFKGPLRILVDREEHVIGQELGSVIWVSPVDGKLPPDLCTRTGCPLPKITASYGYVGSTDT